MQIIEKLRDPLNETTRNVRRNLLASAVIGLLIVKVGLVPEQIAAFGIEFSETNQDALLYMIAAVIAYFLISFVIYLFAEYASWNLAIWSERLEYSRDQVSLDLLNYKKHKAFHEYLGEINKMSDYGKTYLFIRVIVEILIPIIVGIWSIVALLCV